MDMAPAFNYLTCIKFTTTTKTTNHRRPTEQQQQNSSNKTAATKQQQQNSSNKTAAPNKCRAYIDLSSLFSVLFSMLLMVTTKKSQNQYKDTN